MNVSTREGLGVWAAVVVLALVPVSAVVFGVGEWIAYAAIAGSLVAYAAWWWWA